MVAQLIRNGTSSTTGMPSSHFMSMSALTPSCTLKVLRGAARPAHTP